MSAPNQIRDIVADIGVRGRRMPDLVVAPALPLSDVALFLDLPLSTLDALRAQGKGPKCFKLGRRLFVLQSALRDWLDKMAEAEAA